ncbi:MAG: ATP-binding protein, partial [Anaerolineales bacterium]|nr:ATP-binding protein [Anaerolineales bacterium]
MPENNHTSPKYNIHLTQPHGTVIADTAHVEQHFHAPPTAPPIDVGQIKAAFRAANAELRNYPDTIAGIHLARPEVADMLAWLTATEAKEPLAMVLDQPGSGKTVVMHDLLQELEARSIPVLAIKADFLSGIKTPSELADRLGLPASVETCIQQLAAKTSCVVLLDQLDALSLSLSRDQALLTLLLGTLKRLCNLENVRLIASCRTFDYDNDPYISQIKADRTFQLKPLADAEINRVLQTVGLNLNHLLPAHGTLLATPLHLDVYIQAIGEPATDQAPESFHTLQELYHALWQKRITLPIGASSPSERTTAVYKLVDTMQNGRKITAPVAILDDHAAAAA